jgi:hypothetical protein
MSRENDYELLALIGLSIVVGLVIYFFPAPMSLIGLAALGLAALIGPTIVDRAYSSWVHHSGHGDDREQ